MHAPLQLRVTFSGRSRDPDTGTGLRVACVGGRAYVMSNSPVVTVQL